MMVLDCWQLYERTGRPLGDRIFIEKLESLLNINLKKKRAGRPKKDKLVHCSPIFAILREQCVNSLSVAFATI